MMGGTIVVDTSALMAILLNEPEADACAAALGSATACLLSAGTLAECLIVAERRNLAEEMAALVAGGGFEVIPVTEAFAVQIAAAYRRWGKGVHPAGLNFGDCFAYVLSQERRAPLLAVGNDFRRTDSVHVIQASNLDLD